MKAIEKARLKLLCNRFIRSLRFIIHLSINLFLISKEYFQQKFPSLTILFLHVTKPKKERKYDELVEKKKRKKWKGRFARFLHDLSGESVAPSEQASYTRRGKT